MISICIPIFNHDVRPLVEALRSQADRCSDEVEIVCLDDGSRPEFKKTNQILGEICHYVEMPKNMGRSRIRNRFLDYVSGNTDYLIFMDCDLKVVDDHFLERYQESTLEKPDVVVGSHIYADHCPGKRFRLHYVNGVGRTSKPAIERNRMPNKSFMTGNFMIRRDILEQYPFDEAIEGYGHEDTLMGFRLMKSGITVRHIDNPLLAEDLDTNDVYLSKIRHSIINLVKISKEVADPEFDEQVNLLVFWKKMERMHLDSIVEPLFRRLCSWMESRFLKGKGSVALFQFYKLGYLSTLVRNR